MVVKSVVVFVICVSQSAEFKTMWRRAFQAHAEVKRNEHHESSQAIDHIVAVFTSLITVLLLVVLLGAAARPIRASCRCRCCSTS
jgi:hypothetical protein